MPGPSNAGAVPEPNEIREQLSRMTGNILFRSRVKPTEIFHLIAEEAIAGRTLREEDIRARVFPSPPYNPLATNVRTNVRFLRQMIQAYYETAGENDAVLIRLPVRPKKKAMRGISDEPYPVTFTYRGHGLDDTLMRIGKRMLERWTPASLSKALAGFETILERHPHHYEAALCKIECQCLLACYVSAGLPKHTLMNEALARANQLAHERPDDWRAHLCLAAAQLCNADGWDSALSLRRVSSLMPSLSLPGLPWLPATFLLIGQPDEARQFANAIAHLRPHDSAAWVALGFCLYFLRDFPQAEQVFEFARSIDSSAWLALLGLSILYLTTDRAQAALDCHQAMCGLLDNDLVFHGVRLLASRRASQDPGTISADLSAVAHARLLEAADGEDYVQIAVAFIDAHPALAADALKQAAALRQPLALLLPFCPLFDPLRADPEVNQLSDDIARWLSRKTS